MNETTTSAIGTTETTAPVFQSVRLCENRALFSNRSPSDNSCFQFTPKASDWECTRFEGSQQDAPPPTLGKQWAALAGCRSDDVLLKPGAIFTAPNAGVNSTQSFRSSRNFPVTRTEP